MYCRKCGKYIGTDDNYCKDCLKNISSPFSEFDSVEQNTQQNAPQTPTPLTEELPLVQKEGSRKTGLKLAIFAFVLAYLSGIFISIMDIVCQSYLQTGLYEIVTTNFLVTIGAGLVPAIVGFVFGLMSILCFKTEKKQNRILPIATLILGILAVVNACFSTLNVIAMMIYIFA